MSIETRKNPVLNKSIVSGCGERMKYTLQSAAGVFNQVSPDAKTLNSNYARRKDLTALESYYGSNLFSFYTNNHKVKSGLLVSCC